MNRLTEEKKTIFLLESNFHQVYARALLNVFASSLMKMCYGCVVDHPSQIHHECLILSEEETVQLCFDDMLKNVDEDAILQIWNQNVNNLQDISPEVLSDYKLRIFSNEWRANDMKTLSWRENMQRTVIRLIKHERCFHYIYGEGQ